MKKIAVLFICVFLLSGCQNINEMAVDEIMGLFSSEVKKANTYRTGYKYNLPSMMQVDVNESYIEVISTNRYNYYFYVDIVSYYNNIGNYYEVNKDSFYSSKYEINDKISYIEVNIQENDKYLIEIMYNYAKIEVMVDIDDLNLAIINAINILNSVTYNDLIIENYLGNDVLNFTEEIYDIFKTNDTNNSLVFKTEKE
ncbi:MAG: hypothetical protein R3Y13_01240 [bacterium]